MSATREHAMVPKAQPRSYYGQPVIKEPTWTWEIPWYLFAGGMAGASAVLARAAELRGNRELARRAWAISLGAVSVSPPLLISDLGRPERFVNMLRVFKVTSPMSVGSWILAASGTSTALATLNAWTGLFPRGGAAARNTAAALGPPLATYTGALLANTSVPVWHEGRFLLPFSFAGSAAASAGAAAVIATPEKHGGAARRVALFGAVVELAATEISERRLGEIAEPYRQGPASRFSNLAKGLGLAGTALLGLGARRSRAATLAGAAAVLASSASERWSVYKAGFQSAADPKYTVGPQRARLRALEASGR
jgi:Polysulphide reductase, NrfD